MAHPIQCACARVQGRIVQPAHGVRVTCHCRDCQAFARLLGRADAVLDDRGGTEVVATEASNVEISAGGDQLACLSLSPRGLLRWYAACCSRPIANTPRDPRMPYAGVLHTCLATVQPIEPSFGAVRMHVNTASAIGGPAPRRLAGGLLAMAGLMARILRARITGGWRTTPFFDAQGRPLQQPTVPARAQVQEARQAR